MKKNILIAVPLIGAALLTGSACSQKGQEPFKDAPRSDVSNGDPADLIRMPDGFSNAATKCDHGNRIYTAFHGDNAYGSIAVVAKDPTCKQ